MTTLHPHPFAAVTARPTSATPGAFGHIPPNWFAAVMGTGIVADAAATLPVQLPGQRGFAVGMWLLAAAVLVLVTWATAMHWIRHPGAASAHHHDPVTVHFYGAPPMALLTVGAGTLLVGHDLIGTRLAVGIDAVLWVTGTALGLATAVTVPYLQFTGAADPQRRGHAFGGWLMPVVPPMVSAATGALLVPHLPAGQARLSLLIACYAMFGLSLIASFIVITLIWARLSHGDIGPAVLVPTLWIVLGPLGQSITATGLLGGVAHLAVPAPYAGALRDLAPVYGVPVLGFALLWAASAAAVTVRTVRSGLPFALTWWSFTFPVGTCVTGLIGLAEETGAIALRDAAVAAFVLLLLAWAIVAARTIHGILRGALLQAPAR